MLTKSQLARFNQSLELDDDATRRQTLEALLKQSHDDWQAAPDDAVSKIRTSLIALLGGSEVSVFVRQQIVSLLGTFGANAAPAVPVLVKLLEKGIPEATREATARALGRIGKPAASASKELVLHLPEAKPRLAIEILVALRLIGDATRPIREGLLSYWNTPNTVASQAEAVCTLRALKIDCPTAVPFLINLLNDSKDSNLRRLAADALGTFEGSTPGVAPSLLVATIVTGKDDTVAPIATESLNRLGLSPKEAFNECALQLKTSPAAETALRTANPLAVEATIGALSLRDKRVREKAIQILAHHGVAAAEAVTPLRRFLRGDDRFLKLAAAKALWHISKDAHAIDALIELVSESSAPMEMSEDERRQFMQTAIEALWRAGADAKRAVDALSKAVKDSNRHVRESAQRAVASIQRATP